VCGQSRCKNEKGGNPKRMFHETSLIESTSYL
jgi:hypothetical protein